MRRSATTTTHIAGPTVCIEGRVIQRCVVCGQKLVDNLNVAVAANPDGTPGNFSSWAQGAYVQVEGSRSSLIGSMLAGDKVPDDICLDLVE